MDSIDRRLLDVLQRGLPLCAQPYAAVAGEVGASEEECLARVWRMKQLGIIRRLGGVFSTRALGPAVLDEADLAVVTQLQGDIPLEPRPFAAIASRAGIPEEEVLRRVRSYWERGWLRRVAAVPHAGAPAAPAGMQLAKVRRGQEANEPAGRSRQEGVTPVDEQEPHGSQPPDPDDLQSPRAQFPLDREAGQD